MGAFETTAEIKSPGKINAKLLRQSFVELNLPSAGIITFICFLLFIYFTLSFRSLTKGVHFHLRGINLQEEVVQLLNFIGGLNVIK